MDESLILIFPFHLTYVPNTSKWMNNFDSDFLNESLSKSKNLDSDLIEEYNDLFSDFSFARESSSLISMKSSP